MKYVKLITVITVICLVFSSCAVVGRSQAEYFGFKTSVFPVVDEKDTHGGFLGDGEYYLILDCSAETEQAAELIKDWKPFPLTENLQLIMYGGVKNGVHYGYNLSEEAQWPIITNGVYKFVDRHTQAVDKTDDARLFDRGSYNFSIAAYDLDTHTLYYFEFDT